MIARLHEPPPAQVAKLTQSGHDLRPVTVEPASGQPAHVLEQDGARLDLAGEP
jgi:hypothetical protein